ncbi:ATP-dependent protease La, partial [gut metagenome]
VTNLDVGREKSINALEVATAEDKLIILVTQKDPEITDITVEDMYPFGVLAQVRQQTRLPNGALRVLVEGLERVQLTLVSDNAQPKSYFIGQGIVVAETAVTDTETEALRRLLLEATEQWLVENKKVNPDVLETLREQQDVSKMTDAMVGFLSLPMADKEALLEMINPKERMRTLYELICREIEISSLAKSITKQVQVQVEQNQREYYLREQMKA